MSDFFTRVAQRTLGLAPLVSPRRLAGWSASEPTTAPPPVALTPRQVAEPLPPDRRVIVSPVTPDSGDGITRSAVDPNSAPALPALPTGDDVGRSTRHGRRAAMAELPTVSPTKRADAFDAQADGQRGSPTRVSATAVAHPHWSAPQPLLPPLAPPVVQFAPPPGLPVTQRSEPASPTLHITIGRVEVRATAPPAVPTRAPREAAPQQSLADYLKRGAAGRR